MALSITAMRIRVLLPAIAIGLAALGGVYSIYWYVAAESVRDGLLRFIDDRRAEGYRIDHSAITIAGFPAAIAIRVEAPVALSSDGRWRWSSPDVVLRTKVWQTQGIEFELPGRHAITVDGNEKALDAEAVSISLALPSQPAADTRSDSLGFALRAAGIALPDDPKPALGRAIAEVAIEGTLRGPLRGGTGALSTWRDAGGTLDVTRLRLVWGPLTSEGDGTFALDDAMRPIGAMSVRLGGYNEAIDRLVEAGVITARQGLAHKIALAAFAEPSPDGKATARVPVTLQDGSVFVGPIAIAPLPAIQ